MLLLPAALAVAHHLWSRRQARRRAAAWRRAALRFGLRHLGEENDLFDRFADFPFVAERGTVANHGGLHGEHNGLRITVADFECGDGEGTETFTVCFVRRAGLRLPLCVVRPWRLLDVIVAPPSPLRKVCEIESVAGHLLVAGQDEEATRALFGPELRRWVVACGGSKFRLETRGDTFLFHRHERLPTGEVGRLLDDACELEALLSGSR
jgi:hypothetical protein